MLQLIFHGIGDYYLQTDWQAVNKKKNSWACLKHCLTYSLPFLLITSRIPVLVIFITHFIIDRTNIIAYLIAIKNDTKGVSEVGKEIWCRVEDDSVVKYKDDDFNAGRIYLYGKMPDKKTYDISNFGFAKERPFAISIWLYIICDNLAHIICNYIAIKYL